uniref:MAK10-like protein n=1 Tax=Tanacetum cinerariifolium TaxID=118510 RepID=A0A6L2NNR9_TANCI|nr:MAK10-like protein [Tanacetum cinerariifolium]
MRYDDGGESLENVVESGGGDGGLKGCLDPWPSHEDYRNIIELPKRNNVVPFRSDTISLVQKGCSFNGLRSEDPNQHLKDFLKLVDSLDLDGENRKRMRLTVKLRNNILIFQQHHEEYLSEAWTRFKDLLQKVTHHGIDLWLQVQIFYDHVNPVTRRTIDQSAGGKLRDLNPKESWAILEDLALYDNEGWNDPRDFAKLVKAIVLPQDVPSTSDHRLIELENQVQRLMEAHLTPTRHTQVNKITTPCEICSGPTTLSTAWKILNKPSLNTHPRIPMKREIIRDNDEPQNEDPYEVKGATTEEPVVEYFDTFLTRDELTYHRKLNPREGANEGISNLTGRIKEMHVFIGNFTYVIDFMIIEDISSILDPKSSQVILGRPFIEISNMTHDPPEGVIH